MDNWHNVNGWTTQGSIPMYSHNQHSVPSITLFHKGVGLVFAVTRRQLQCWLALSLLSLLGLPCLLLPLTYIASWRARADGRETTCGGSDVTHYKECLGILGVYVRAGYLHLLDDLGLPQVWPYVVHLPSLSGDPRSGWMGGRFVCGCRSGGLCAGEGHIDRWPKTAGTPLP